ncbi:hypothetical protein JIN85_05275 [Luteolibacter pohnpeiensis]|uniref:SGNH/GDSL hydrolase family protein n=1 Tax=Luteolibacter pohnpeiensis TaxID=454153 RepID=A0A934S9G8_9BACT|nr:hypothetical protein [Luteolibacter pohnpeiensis]MBK1881814.1 hypothetical protein [Luteolibacter pohnpeiensis]
MKYVLIFCILATAACAPLYLGRDKKPARSVADAQRELHDRVASKSKPAVLFVGNSYSFGMPKALAAECAKHDQPIRIGHSTFSGWSLAQHVKNESTLKKIREGKWDVVVLQEQSQIPSFKGFRRNHRMLPAVKKLAAEARAAGAVPVLYQTWGRLHGDQQNVPGDTSAAMSARLAEGYRVASKAAGGLVVIPAGDAWAKEIATGHGNQLFIEDGSHPTSIGNQLTARVFYNSLFSAVHDNGIALRGIVP